jgi:PIN domain nuclease of toxin-antitoxin system
LTIIRDASAVLCVLNGERGVPGDFLPTQLAGRTLAVVPFDEAEAYAAGKLRPATRRAGLSFGDRACLALAISRGAAVLTADRRMAEPPLGPDVRVIR